MCARRPGKLACQIYSAAINSARISLSFIPRRTGKFLSSPEEMLDRVGGGADSDAQPGLNKRKQGS